MKKILIILSCVLVNALALRAENFPECFNGNEILTNIFVNPMGIQNVIGINDADSLINHIEKLGLDYKSIDLGNYGKVVSISPEGFSIGNVPVSRMMIIVQNDMNGIVIQSAKDDNYKEMDLYLNRLLSEYAPTTDNVQGYQTYMFDNNIGVVVGSMDNLKTSMAILMDMKNLPGFLSLSQNKD